MQRRAKQACAWPTRGCDACVVAARASCVYTPHPSRAFCSNPLKLPRVASAAVPPHVPPSHDLMFSLRRPVPSVPPRPPCLPCLEPPPVGGGHARAGSSSSTRVGCMCLLLSCLSSLAPLQCPLLSVAFVPRGRPPLPHLSKPCLLWLRRLCPLDCVLSAAGATRSPLLLPDVCCPAFFAYTTLPPLHRCVASPPSSPTPTCFRQLPSNSITSKLLNSYFCKCDRPATPAALTCNIQEPAFMATQHDDEAKASLCIGARARTRARTRARAHARAHARTHARTCGRCRRRLWRWGRRTVPLKQTWALPLQL